VHDTLVDDCRSSAQQEFPHLVTARGPNIQSDSVSHEGAYNRGRLAAVDLGFVAARSTLRSQRLERNADAYRLVVQFEVEFGAGPVDELRSRALGLDDEMLLSYPGAALVKGERPTV
jgi:hypothetical protein